MLLCQVCKQNPATVHVTEIQQVAHVTAFGGPAESSGNLPTSGAGSTGVPGAASVQGAAAPAGAGGPESQAAGAQAPIATGKAPATKLQAGASDASAAVPSKSVSGAVGHDGVSGVGPGSIVSGGIGPGSIGSGSIGSGNGSASKTNAPQIQQQHVCEPCAHAMKLPYGNKSSVQDILKLIKAAHPQRTRAPGGLACPECGITLVEFRQRGRLGCPKDYEVFGTQLRDLLERIHGSSQHVGRAPDGVSSEEAGSEAVKRMQRITELRAALDTAIRDEAYEAAAKLRDELRTLQRS